MVNAQFVMSVPGGTLGGGVVRRLIKQWETWSGWERGLLVEILSARAG